MRTIEIEEKDLVLEIPESWDEMSPDMAHYCLRLAEKMLNGLISEDLFRLKCFYKVAQIKRNWRSVLWEKLVSEQTLLRKNANAWRHSVYFTDFMFKAVEAKEGDKQIELPLQEFAFDALVNFFPEFTVAGTKFYGPEFLLMDLTFAEFRAALEELNNYFDSKEEHQLSRLFAVVNRPGIKTPEGIKKVPFNRDHTERYAKKLDKLPQWQRMAMLLHFTWSINYIKSEDLIIEGRMINFSPLFPKGSKSGNNDSKPSTGWMGVLFGIAEKGIFGNVKESDQTNLFDILMFLYENYLQGEEIKRQTKSNKK